jgi:hypothetical protein
MEGLGAAAEAAGPKLWKLRRLDFVVQFAWKPTLRHTRELARQGIVEGIPADQSF